MHLCQDIFFQMATSGSEQLNNENLQPQTGENTQEAVAAGDAPPKSAKQLAKEAEKAEKLKKFAEKQKAKEEAEKKVPFTFRSNKKSHKNYLFHFLEKGERRKWCWKGKSTSTRYHRIHFTNCRR